MTSVLYSLRIGGYGRYKRGQVFDLIPDALHFTRLGYRVTLVADTGPSIAISYTDGQHHLAPSDAFSKVITEMIRTHPTFVEPRNA